MVFYPPLKSSPLACYNEEQPKQLLDGKSIIADVAMADGRHSKAFVQIDEETKQVMYISFRHLRLLTVCRHNYIIIYNIISPHM